MEIEAEKKRAALQAVALIEDGMLVGLGTGSTAEYAIREIASKVATGLRVTGVATSRRTRALAERLSIPLLEMEDVPRLDLCIDGADEVDLELRAIKGGGGAMLREKIVASASDRMIVIADSSKLVAALGRFPLPVEVLPFARASARRQLDEICPQVEQRRTQSGEPFLTDQEAYIFDLPLEEIEDPPTLARELESIPGLIGHGLFLNEVGTAIVGQRGATKIIDRIEPGARKSRGGS
ncbi:MAG: ribose-5-phosphate isomerase RpiA [Sphingomicrobium sp.]